MSLNRAILRVGAAAVARSVAKPGSAAPALAVTSRRSMGTFEERERGEEAVYMRQEDKRLLAKLLAKEKATAEKTTSGKAELKAILGDHKLPEDVIERLLAWKAT